MKEMGVMSSLQEQIDTMSKSIKTDSYPMSIGELAALYRDGDLDISPVYQRMFRWDMEQQSALIESILLQIPIPPIYVYQSEDGKWNLIDGQQRLSTIFKFMGILKKDMHDVDDEETNEDLYEREPLTRTKFLPALEGKYWEDDDPEKSLTDAQRRYIKRSRILIIIIDKSSDTVGLVGMWDCVAFDEVAGIKFKDKDGIQIMKGYMASGAFSRGKAEIQAKASMVFVGNINQSVDTLLKTSSLFDPFPPEMGTDTAFLDRMHCYIPGWEIPPYQPSSFTNDYGFITDYLSEFMRELRKENYSDIAERYFKFGDHLKQRDAIAIRKLISGFIKLLYPDGEVTKDEVREIIDISMELRRRVKEQLKKIGGMEFYDVNFSYRDNDSFEEYYVSVPEQGGGKLIPEGMGKPGSVYTVSKSKTGMIGCYMLETQMMPGNGKLTCTGIGSGKEPKEATNTAFNYLKANGNRISGQISTTTKDYIINYQDMQGIGMTGNLALPTLIAICSAALGKTPLNSLAILGEISIGGTLIKVDELASTLQVCLDSGAKKVLLPITSAGDLGTVPSDLVGAFSLIFYSSAEEAVFKALGVE